MPELTIGELRQSCNKELRLDVAAGEKGLGRVVRVGELNRPGLSLAGYFEFFRPERIQIIGQGEYAYLQTLDNARRLEVIEKVFSFKDLPCVIVTHGKDVLLEIVEKANQAGVPALKTDLPTAHLVRELSAYLENRLAPMEVVHGVLTVVYGLGVLIVGKSGTGKSECGLELVKRGHILVSDDVVEVRHHPGDILIGSVGPMIKHYMEVRGLGIIDIQQIFGVSATKDSAKIELVVRLETELKDNDFERVGLGNRTTKILDVELPEIVLPLRPGRNVAVLMEVAALNERLKQDGIVPAEELDRKLIKKMGQQPVKRPGR